MRWWAWALMLPAAYYVALIVVEYQKSPTTYTEMAAQSKARCIANKGDGGWRGSSGITLDTYCRLRSSAEAMEALCKAHPERC